MASFAATQKTQFSPFIPTIDSQTMAGALAHKDQEYQAGLAKVQAITDNVSAIPVATPWEKEYISGKIKGMVSEINQKVGTDYSDARSVNQIGGHISSLVNDPYVQTATQNAYAMKAENQKAKDNTDKTDGANSYNLNYFNKQNQNFMQHGKLGDTYKVSYDNYHDLDGGIKEYLSALHPFKEVKQDVSGAATADKWSKGTFTVKGIDPSIVEKEIKVYIDTTPGAKKQIEINADSTYENYTPFDYVKRNQELNQTRYNQIGQDLNKKVLLNAKIVDSNLKNELNNTILGLIKEQYEIQNHDYSIDFYNFVKKGDEIKKDLYEKEFTIGQIGKYSYGGEEEVSYDGNPWDKTLALNNYKLRLNADRRASEMFAMDMKIKQAKLDGVHNASDIPMYSSNLPIKPEDKNQAFNNYSRSIVNEGLDITQQQIEFLYNKFKQSGNINNDEIFGEDDNKRHFIKNKMVAGLKNKLGQPVSSKDYYMLGYDDEKGVHHPGVINDWTEKASRGYYGPDEKGFTLTNYDIETLTSLNKKNSLYKAGLEEKSKIQEKANNLPIVKELNHKIDVLNQNPIHASVKDLNGNNITTSYTGQNVLDFVQAQQELETQYKEQTKGLSSKEDGSQMSNIYNSLKKEIYPKYGLNNNQIEAIHTSSIYTDIKQHYLTAIEDQNKVLNKEADDRGYTQQSSMLKWTMGYKKDIPQQGQLTDQTILNNIKNHIVATYNNFDNAPEGFKNILLEKKPNDKPQAEVVWNPNRKQYEVTVSDVSYGKSQPLYLDENQASKLGVPGIKPKEDYLFLKMKRLGGQTFSSTDGMHFENAEPIATLGKYEYRVHLIDRGNSYTLQPYKLNTQEPVGKNNPQTLKDITTTTHDYDKVSGSLEKLIYGAKTTPVVDNPVEENKDFNYEYQDNN